VSGLHIGYLVQQFPPEVGAGPARVLEMGRRWIERGARVTVFTAMPNRPEGRIHAAYRGRLVVSEHLDGIRAYRTWLYARPEHGFVRTLANNLSFMLTSGALGLARSARIDVLIASSPPFFPHVSGWAVSALRRIPLVLEVRDLWPDYLVDMGLLRARGPATRTLFALERFLLRRAAAVTVVTEPFRTRVIGKGVAADRIAVLPNGVDTRFYRPLDEPPPFPGMARQSGEFLVGYLGNIGAGQALTVVLEAAARLAPADPSVRFVVAGDGPERRRLEERAAALRLPNFSMHPPIPKDATRAFYNSCDLCLVPLAPVPVFQETIPSKIFEIMACERLVLASVEGEGRRVLTESGAGLLAPPGDPGALAEGVLRARDLPVEQRLAMGRAGRAYVAAHYSRVAIADRYLELLEAVRRAA
jgi:glycosyltransferase involved in cell wall biosynthesis